MMIKKGMSFFVLTALVFSAVAQGEYDEKYEFHMKEVEPIETDQFKVEFTNVHCQGTFAMGKMKITNKTSDYLVFDQSNIKGEFDFGSLENEKGKELFIDPYDNVSRNFKFTGSNMQVKSFSIEVSAFSTLAIAGTVQEAEEFHIPPKSNVAKIGNFECTFDRMGKRTDKLATTFKCRYNGSHVGLVDETKATWIYPTGNEYANAQNKQKIELMEAGDEKKFSFNCSEHKSDGDLQFIEMKIKWNNTFVESQRTPLDPFTVNFEFDQAKTDESN